MRNSIPVSRFACLSPIFGQPAQDVRQHFRNLPKAYRPMVRWWWPGGDVSDEELRRDVRVLDEAGFGGGEIQPFVIGLNPKMDADVRKRVNDYLTPAFFAHVRAALDEARARGLWLDYTFGSGWPFGGGMEITPELASLELRYAHLAVHGPMHLSGKPPEPKAAAGLGAMVAWLSGAPDYLPDGWKERMEKRSKLVAVVPYRGSEAQVGPRRQQFLMNPDGDVKRTGMLDESSAVVLTSRLRPDGTLGWEVPEGEDGSKRADLKSFSGKSRYRTTFDLDRAWLKKAVIVDLAQVEDVAEISINRKPGPVLLRRSYRANIAPLLKPGRNTLEVVVINTLFNSIAARGKDVNSFPGMPGFGGKTQLMPSGLMGLVTLRME